jgi:Holliday junction resolvase
MSDEENKVVVIDVVVRNDAELQKIRENTEGIAEFAEKFGDRYGIRMKLDKTLWNYLTEIKLVLPVLDKVKFSELYLNLLKVLGFSLLHFHIYIFYLSNFF